MRSYYEFLLSENKKVDAPNNEIFVEKRKSGAAEIARKATSKGKYSILTSWHFKAKNPIYKMCEEAIQRDEPISWFEKRYQETMSKLHRSGLHTQREFQKIMGELETFGEILIQIRSGKKY